MSSHCLFSSLMQMRISTGWRSHRGAVFVFAFVHLLSTGLFAASLSLMPMGSALGAVVILESSNGIAWPSDPAIEVPGSAAVSIGLAAGVYQIIPVDISNNLVAWNAFGNTLANCIGDGPCEKGLTIDYGFWWAGLDDAAGPDPVGNWINVQSALAQATPLTLSLPISATVFFWLTDGTPANNTGGLTLQLTPVPLPGALLLLISALAGFGLLSARSRRQ